MNQIAPCNDAAGNLLHTLNQRIGCYPVLKEPYDLGSINNNRCYPHFEFHVNVEQITIPTLIDLVCGRENLF